MIRSQRKQLNKLLIWLHTEIDHWKQNYVCTVDHNLLSAMATGYVAEINNKPQRETEFSIKEITKRIKDYSQEHNLHPNILEEINGQNTNTK